VVAAPVPSSRAGHADSASPCARRPGLLAFQQEQQEHAALFGGKLLQSFCPRAAAADLQAVSLQPVDPWSVARKPTGQFWPNRSCPATVDPATRFSPLCPP